MARSSGRKRLLDTAETLFAEHGVEGVSLRRINAEAGLSPAALHYHFGSRDALLQAVLVRGLSGQMTRRRQRLQALRADPDSSDLRAIVQAMVLPSAETLVEGGPRAQPFLRLLSRLYSDRSVLLAKVTVEHFPDGVEAFDALLRRALPHVPLDVLRVRRALAFEGMVHALANPDILSQSLTPEEAAPDLALFVSTLTDYLVGALGAPVSMSQSSKGRSPQ